MTASPLKDWKSSIALTKNEAVKPASEKSAQPKPKTEVPVNTVEKPPKRKISLVVGLIVIAFSLIGVWQFIAIHAKLDAASEIAKLESDMVAIKGGTFQMGSPKTEPERNDDEKQHKVMVTDFQMSKYEVTQAQWQAVMGKNPSNFKGDNLPVEQVSYNDVQDFINKLNAQMGKTYRLPTEAEWEYAARAGTTTPFYTGNCINSEQTNYEGTGDNNCGVKIGVFKETTVAVGSYPANPWGLYDMAGNVWEWTCSAYDKNYGGSEKQCYSNNDANNRPVIRGGSWNFGAKDLRSATRSGIYTPDDRYIYIGFRLSRM
jgi:formylglycine-generating enzyme required for sulfatase activity